MTEGIDRAVSGAAIRAANGFTRRSLFGRVAGATAALTTAGLAFEASPALALCPGNSITCNTLYGGNHNFCSENTCNDGSWNVPPGNCDAVASCGSKWTRWRDCCVRPSDCGCHHPSGYPSCCNDCIYRTNGTTPGGSCSSAYSKVRCRHWGCVG